MLDRAMGRIFGLCFDVQANRAVNTLRPSRCFQTAKISMMKRVLLVDAVKQALRRPRSLPSERLQGIPEYLPMALLNCFAVTVLKVDGSLHSIPPLDPDPDPDIRRHPSFSDF